MNIREHNFEKVLVLFGSPRKKSTSNRLAEQVIKGAEAKGAQVERVYINQLEIKGCQGCYSCKKEGAKGCRIKDDMQEVYPKMLEAGSWIIATPVYWFNMTAQTKLVIDRTFGIFNDYAENPNPLKGKRIAIAMSYGDKDAFASGCINALRTFQDAFRYIGANITGMVYGSAEKPAEMEENTALMEDALKLGERLVHRN